MKKWLIGFCLLAVAVMSGAGAGILFNSATVFAGVKIDGHDLGGMRRLEMEDWLRNKAAEADKATLTFYYQDANYSLDAKQIEYMIDVDETANAVWGYGREGSIWQRIKKIHYARSRGYEVPVNLRYSEEQLKKVLEQWAGKIDRPAKNASLNLDTGKIIPAQTGYRMDREKNKDQVLQALREQQTRIPIIVEEILPHISAEDIEKSGVKDLLGIYTTYFNSNDINRTENIRLAVDKINGTLIQPGEVFSYNEIVGPRDTQHGFKEGLEIVNGEFVPGIGGGVCQVSSTLYNAVLYAGMQIVERTNHSKPLSYVPLGRDATVAYGYLDFKFVNNLKTPILVLAEIQGNQLKMGVFGKEIPGETIKILVVDRKEIPPGVTQKADPLLYVGETKLEQAGIPGYEATVLRTWNINGQEVRREFLSTDRYLPANTIMRVGTKPHSVSDKLPPAATTMAPVQGGADKKAPEIKGDEKESKKQG